MTRLDDTEHSSYSLWPGSFIKKEIDMKFYLRPMSDYKLSCELNPDRKLKTIFQNHNIEGGFKSVSVMFDKVETYGLACLLVILIAPLSS